MFTARKLIEKKIKINENKNRKTQFGLRKLSKIKNHKLQKKIVIITNLKQKGLEKRTKQFNVIIMSHNNLQGLIELW